MDLKPLREEIDRIDNDLVTLLDRRAEIARMVGESKAQAGKTTFDAGRAKAVVHQALSRSNGQFPNEGMVYVFREILSACLNLQKSLRVGFMGPRDTYSHLAAIREFGSSVEFVPFKVIRDVFTAVENAEIDYGVVPIENSTGGTVHLTLDAFIEHPCRVCSEVLLPIHISLLGHSDLSSIRKVYSHPQPFIQSDNWLKKNLPNVARLEVDSTTQGMVEAKKDPHAAAIGNEFAADEYGLRILAKNIEDSDDNTTRFLVISKNDTQPSGDDKTSLMFSVADRPGALLRVLKPFDDLRINLSKLESRPTKRRAWEQAFFVDADGHRTEEKIQCALEEIRPHCEKVVVLVSYPRDKSTKESRTSH
ncbi:prephenate dehydratase [Candidatus Sumerlaeota bacterium]|nr:prephenate dehydratase [Candidatus Sumerlaeota bacterium]